MAKQMRAGVKAALIGGFCLIAAAIITGILSNSGSNSSQTSIQKVGEQKNDTGTINNFNASRDINILYKTPEDTIKASSVKQEIKQATITDKKEASVNRNPSKPKQKNQIINNAPNQGVQINENNGTVVVPKPLQRNFTANNAKLILKNFPIDSPIEIWLKGTNSESKKFFNQVADVVKFLGYKNISLNTIGIYGTTEVIEKDFQYGIENGKFIFSIYLQQ